MMRLISSSRATSAACRPAAPPKLSSANLSRIDAAAQRHQADAVGHLQIDHAVDAGGGSRSRDSSSASAMRSTAASDAARSSGRCAAHEGGGIEIAEHDIGVGDGGSLRRHCRSRPGPAPSPRSPARHAACGWRRRWRSSRRRRRCWRCRGCAARCAGLRACRRPTARPAPSAISEMSVEVPPMSNGTRSGMPSISGAAARRRRCRPPGPTARCPRRAARLPRPAPCRHATARRTASPLKPASCRPRSRLVR